MDTIMKCIYCKRSNRTMDRAIPKNWGTVKQKLTYHRDSPYVQVTTYKNIILCPTHNTSEIVEKVSAS